MLRNIKLIAFIALIIMVCICNHYCGWSTYLCDLNHLSFLQKMVQQNFWQAAFCYTVLTIVGCVVLALPGITFALFAGILFGPWWGTILCLIATTLGAMIAFLMGRYFLKDAIKPMIMKNENLKKVLFDEREKKDLILLMITRLVPLFPYNIQNFAYGITDIAFSRYSLYTFLFMLPGVSFITIGAAGITDQVNRGQYFSIAGILFVAVFFVGNTLQKKYINVES